MHFSSLFSNEKFSISIWGVVGVFYPLLAFSFFPFVFGCTGSVLLCGLSLVVASRGYSLDVVHGLLTAVAPLVVEHGLLACGLQ